MEDLTLNGMEILTSILREFDAAWIRVFRTGIDGGVL
jgi:hypothetical protein